MTPGQIEASLTCLEWSLAERDLRHFTKQAWQVIEPETPLVWGWHLDAICDHLTAVNEGHIRRLVINIPPRHTKSLTVSVMWPSWTWINYPHKRWLYSSYAQELSTRDSVKCRRLIQSPWYQIRWGDRFSLTGDQNQKTRFENDKFGYRLATSVEGMGTGEGGDFIVVDDPHNVKEGESDLKRAGVLTWWDETMSTRVTDPKLAAHVIVMQRVHEADLSGHVLEKDRGYVHLCLPARYEGNRVKSPLNFTDPRTVQREPLSPYRFGEKELDDLRNDMSEYAWAGQMQQRPAPRGGGCFKVENFKIKPNIPNPSNILAAVRYWDKAGTDDGGAYTAGVLMFRLRSGRFFIADVVRAQYEAVKREKMMKMTALVDQSLYDKASGAPLWLKGKYVVWVEQEPGSGGKESAESTIRNLSQWVVKADRVTGDKVTRSEPYATQLEHGNIEVLAAPWTMDFIKEHEKAPVGKYKDQWDAASGAFNKLAAVKQVGVW